MNEMNKFEEQIADFSNNGLYSSKIKTLQVNIGLKCNQRCKHCHLEASTKRNESMEWSTMERVIEAAEAIGCQQVDITGGAPELNPYFCRFVEALRKNGHLVLVRTNLTVLLEPGMENMALFYKINQIKLVASLPCYLEKNVRAQRGVGVYEKSIEVLKGLNNLGYGIYPDLPLDLVYNPGGAFLPADQRALEADYRKNLAEHFGINFSHLITITNMPIGNFLTCLHTQQQDLQYLQLLESAFNPKTLDGLMCREQLSVGWDGTLYDCDFNLALGCPVNHGAPDHLDKLDISALNKRRIVTGDHCFGCTAGSGSSCSGALL